MGADWVLINSSLSSIPVYAMSMYLLPLSTIKKMDTARKRFFWQGGSLKRKYHLIKWSKITKPKQKGGLGVKVLRKINISLLIWQDIVRKK